MREILAAVLLFVLLLPPGCQKSADGWEPKYSGLESIWRILDREARKP
jgi:hypothetical protein